jgi:hypothetical protein
MCDPLHPLKRGETEQYLFDLKKLIKKIKQKQPSIKVPLQGI